MAKTSNKRKVPAGASSTLTTETVAKVAAALIDFPNLGAAVPDEKCDKAVIFALRLIERSAIAVEGDGSPTARRAARRMGEAQVRLERVWQDKKEALEADDWDEATYRTAEGIADRLNGKSYRLRLIELGFVRTGGGRRDVTKWEKFFLGEDLYNLDKRDSVECAKKLMSESSPPEGTRKWKLVQRLRGATIPKAGDSLENFSWSPESSPPDFNPERDYRVLCEIADLEAWYAKVMKSTKTKSGKRLSRNSAAKKK